MATAVTQAQAISLAPVQLAALTNLNQGTQSLTQYQKVMQSLAPPACRRPLPGKVSGLEVKVGARGPGIRRGWG